MSSENEAPGGLDFSRLEAAVASLRPLDREIFLARRLDGMSYREIATVTGLSRARVKRCMARALREIDRYIAGERPPRWRRWLRR